MCCPSYLVPWAKRGRGVGVDRPPSHERVVISDYTIYEETKNWTAHLTPTISSTGHNNARITQVEQIQTLIWCVETLFAVLYTVKWAIRLQAPTFCNIAYTLEAIYLDNFCKAVKHSRGSSNYTVKLQRRASTQVVRSLGPPPHPPFSITTYHSYFVNLTAQLGGTQGLLNIWHSCG